jgi:hypothetical protein
MRYGLSLRGNGPHLQHDQDRPASRTPAGTEFAEQFRNVRFAHLGDRNVNHLAKALAFLALAMFASPALAADPSVGFWTGFVDGFLSLLKLLVSPLIDVTVVSEDFGPWGYAVGYYAGILSFAAAAGAASFPTEPDRADVRWG